MNVDVLIDDVRERGYCLLEGVVSESSCEEIRQRLLVVIDQHRVPTAPERVGFVSSVINHDQSFAP